MNGPKEHKCGWCGMDLAGALGHYCPGPQQQSALAQQSQGQLGSARAIAVQRDIQRELTQDAQASGMTPWEQYAAANAALAITKTENAQLRARVTELEALTLNEATACDCGAYAKDCARDAHAQRGTPCVGGCRYEQTDHDSLRCNACGAEISGQNLAALGIRHTGRLEEDLRRKREEAERLEARLGNARLMQSAAEANLLETQRDLAEARVEVRQLRRELGRRK